MKRTKQVALALAAATAAAVLTGCGTGGSQEPNGSSGENTPSPAAATEGTS